jgi:quercetin 2,3-dioxygenase
MSIRAVKKVITAKPTLEGAGVHLRRAFGFGQTSDYDPFLLLDDFRNDVPEDYLAGFPWHPHRGIETITYVLAGTVEHGDSLGNRGAIAAGDIQWMTAGRGIIHSEMPEQTLGRMRGFQLWVNLPAAQKMSPPRYQELDADRFTTVEPASGVRATIVAGTLDGVSGPVTGIAIDPLYADLRLQPGAAHDVSIPAGHTAVIYVFDGTVSVGDAALPKGTLAVLGDGTHVRIAAGDAGAALLLIAGRPIGEPIARYGPFVMNTREEIAQAFADFQAGRF